MMVRSKTLLGGFGLRIGRDYYYGTFGPQIQIGIGYRADAPLGEIPWRWYREWLPRMPVWVTPIYDFEGIGGVPSSAWTGRDMQWAALEIEYGFGLNRRVRRITLRDMHKVAG